MVLPNGSPGASSDSLRLYVFSLRPAPANPVAPPLPGRYYTSSDLFTAEREHIFERRWICVGRASDVSEPGDFMLVTVAGESIIVLRDRSGQLRAFYNVCRHRGTRLCDTPRGRLSETLQCPYHA